MKPIDPFYHPPTQQPTQTPQGSSRGILTNLSELSIGKGKYGFYVNRQGMYMGNQDASRAPFGVDMLGKATFRDELGQTIIDASGIKSDTQFLSTAIEDFTDRTTNSITPKAIPFTTLDLLVQRTTNINIPITVTCYFSGLTGGDAGADPIGVVQLVIDGVTQIFKIKFQDMRLYTPETTGLSISRTLTLSYQKIIQITPGPHEIKLVFYLTTASSYMMHIAQSSIGYITFGK